MRAFAVVVAALALVPSSLFAAPIVFEEEPAYKVVTFETTLSLTFYVEYPAFSSDLGPDWHSTLGERQGGDGAFGQVFPIDPDSLPFTWALEIHPDSHSTYDPSYSATFDVLLRLPQDWRLP